MSTNEPSAAPPAPPVVPPDPGWTQGGVDRLIELAHGLLSSAAERVLTADAIPGWRDTLTEFLRLYHEWLKLDAEDVCHRCGHDYTPWTAPSPLWNEVMRAGDINAPEIFRGMVCPSCFMALAEAGGIATRWRLYPVTVFRMLQTVTPSGRVWNPETWMFDDPPPPAPPTRHGYTTHGHPCCGAAPIGDRPRKVFRCGGVNRCSLCAMWASQIHNPPVKATS